MSLANKIIEERKKKGWSQEDLAEKLGISRQSVSKWESAGSVPDLQKIIQLSSLFGVATDYLLKDNEAFSNNDFEEAGPYVTQEEANSFLLLKAKQSPEIANATSLCILSPVLLLVLNAFSESKMYFISDSIAAGLGCSVLIMLVAIAVFIFIRSGIKMNHYRYLEEESFKTESRVIEMAKTKSNEFENKYSASIAVGVVLCIVSAIPLIIAGAFDASDSICILSVALLLVLISIAVNIMIRVGMIKNSYDTLLEEGDFSKKEKVAKKKMGAFSVSYWCVSTAIYLLWSFLTDRWNFTWIVWPVVGVLFAAVSLLFRKLIKVDNV